MMADPPLLGDVSLLDDATAASLLPARPADAHKGTFGRVVVVAGSLDYAGAALLVAGAAARAGAGLVTLAVPASLQPVVAGRILEITTRGLAETATGEIDATRALAELVDVAHDALIVGPGLAPLASTGDLVRGLLSTDQAGSGPVVVDAEALNALAREPGWATAVRRPAIVTPHPGEFARLCHADPALARWAEPAADDHERAAAARAAASAWGVVVVLKGARTVVASPDGPVTRAPFANPALGTAGSGDVLAGVIGALLAQGSSTWDAARLGVYLHGMAGEAARDALGDAGVVAPDLLLQLPLAWRRLAALRRGRGRLGFAATAERAS